LVYSFKGIPDAVDRLDILTKMLKSIPNNLNNNDLEQLNSKFHGYVGADIAAVCREAGLNTIKRVQACLGNDATDEAVANDERLIIDYEDLAIGMSKIRPSVVREITIEVPKVYWYILK
jgi:AAA family ATPase